jgi:hypothetical protein
VVIYQRFLVTTLLWKQIPAAVVFLEAPVAVKAFVLALV